MGGNTGIFLRGDSRGWHNYKCLEQGVQKNTSILAGRIEKFKIPDNEKLRKYY